MISTVLLVVLSAAPMPRAFPDADVVVHLPKLDGAQGVVSFFEAAGRRSALVRPDAWAQELHPFFNLRPGHLEDFQNVGIDPAGSLTVSLRGDDRMTCTRVKDLARFEERAKRHLAARGELVTRKESGATLTFAKVGARADSGYAVKGNQVCAFASLANDQSMLKHAARAVTRPVVTAAMKKAQGLPGTAQVLSPNGVAAMEGSPSELRATVLGSLDLPGVRPGESPFAKMQPSGVVFARGQLDASSRRRWVARALSYASESCSACRLDPEPLAAVLDQHLTGNFVLRVDSVKVQGALSSPEARYSAVKHGLLFEVKNADALRKAFKDATEGLRGAQQVDGELQLPLASSIVRMGVNPQFLYLANDERALEQLIATERGSPGKVPHGLEYVIDPVGVNRAFSQVSLLDAFASKELAALFAAAAELGPLLRQTRTVRGWVDSERSGGHRAFVEWLLEAPP